MDKIEKSNKKLLKLKRRNTLQGFSVSEKLKARKGFLFRSEELKISRVALSAPPAWCFCINLLPQLCKQPPLQLAPCANCGSHIHELLFGTSTDSSVPSLPFEIPTFQETEIAYSIWVKVLPERWRYPVSTPSLDAFFRLVTEDSSQRKVSREATLKASAWIV